MFLRSDWDATAAHCCHLNAAGETASALFILASECQSQNSWSEISGVWFETRTGIKVRLYFTIYRVVCWTKSPPPYAPFPNSMFPCDTTMLENRKRTDSWGEQSQFWPTKNDHKTFPDSEGGKCRLVSLGSGKSILEAEVHLWPRAAGSSYMEV